MILVRGKLVHELKFAHARYRVRVWGCVKVLVELSSPFGISSAFRI